MKKLIEFISLKIISPLKWDRLHYLFTGKAYDISSSDRDSLRDMAEHGFYIFVTRRETHLTTYLISFGDWVLSLGVWVRNRFKGPRPRFGFWSHAFLNIDEIHFMEAINKGVVISHFDDVFDCDAVCVLMPKFFHHADWGPVVAKALDLKGRNYDTVFNLADDSELSCIELVRAALKASPNYEKAFADFEHSIQTYNNLTPQMLYDSTSFAKVWEVRR